MNTKVVSFLSSSLMLIMEAGGFAQSAFSSPSSADFQRQAMKLRANVLLKLQPQTAAPAANHSGPRLDLRLPWKTDIVTVLIWIGEPGSGKSSAWDPEWERHYGGPDNPAPSARLDYSPIKFTARLNPFYCALPYNDVTRNTTKPEAAMVIPWFKEAYRKYGESVCRNRWIAIRNHNGRLCYAQWSDCGPIGTDQWQYVFGNERPTSNSIHGAGLGVSPAVRDYLGLSQMDVTSWRFVEFRDVPSGPWSNYGDNNDFVISARRNPARATSRPTDAGGSETVIAKPSPGVPTTITR